MAEDVDEKVLVVDATDQVMGRLASKVAKLLLEGYRVYIVNAPNTLISGKKKSVVREWKEFLKIGSVIHPRHGPYHPRRPDTILRDVIKGMVPRRKPRGREALRRLRVYNYVPDELPKGRVVRFKEAEPRKPRMYYMTLGELARELGWKQ